MPDVINFNGTSYNSLDDMPPDVRQMYEQVMGVFKDANQNGVPDMLEGLISPEMAQHLKQQIAAIVFNGQSYASLEHMPPEARAGYEQFMATYGPNRSGQPNAVEGMAAQPAGTSTPPGWLNTLPTNSSSAMSAADAAAAPAFAASAPLVAPTPSSIFGNTGSTSAISPEGGDNRMRLALIAIVALAVIACGLAVVVAWALLR